MLNKEERWKREVVFLFGGRGRVELSHISDVWDKRSATCVRNATFFFYTHKNLFQCFHVMIQAVKYFSKYPNLCRSTAVLQNEVKRTQCMIVGFQAVFNIT